MSIPVAYPYLLSTSNFENGEEFYCVNCNNKIAFDKSEKITFCDNCGLFESSSILFRVKEWTSFRELVKKSREWFVLNLFFKYSLKRINDRVIEEINNKSIFYESPDFLYDGVGYEIVEPFDSEAEAIVENVFANQKYKNLSQEVVDNTKTKNNIEIKNGRISYPGTKRNDMYKRVLFFIKKKEKKLKQYRNSNQGKIILLVFIRGHRLKYPGEVRDFQKWFKLNHSTTFDGIYLVILGQWKGIAEISPFDKIILR